MSRTPAPTSSPYCCLSELFCLLRHFLVLYACLIALHDYYRADVALNFSDDLIRFEFHIQSCTLEVYHV